MDAQPIADRDKGLPPHCIGTACEKNFDLMVIQGGAVIGQPPAGLIVEVLHVIAGAAGRGDIVKNIIIGLQSPPKIDRGDIFYKPGGIAQHLDWRRDDICGGWVITVFHILPVLALQTAQVFQDQGPARQCSRRRGGTIKRGGQALRQTVLRAEPQGP